MKKLFAVLRPALICFAVMTLLCGVLYTAAVTGLAQLFFPDRANGSIIRITQSDGSIREYGSELIAQDFTKPGYLIGRPAGVSNLSPTSKEQATLVQERIDRWHSFDPENKADIPADLVTASGSGVDPYLSPEGAAYQVARIAKARGIPQDAVREAIEQYTTGKLLGFLGEPVVNVLKVNLALDGLLR
ncbi:Potassium-transporting ATPase KdpC subunit [bioreactor metagenome]|uniref:Potassium-transporting ATPase KdpC subunit n=1 Tax=bioreactor metagenome TaxID=1076179 RepID=A0A645BHX7_9ZZZZ